MKIIDKIVDFFFDYKIKPKYLTEIRDVYGEYCLASIYVKLPFVKKYYDSYLCEGMDCILPLFPGIEIQEGLKLYHGARLP